MTKIAKCYVIALFLTRNVIPNQDLSGRIVDFNANVHTARLIIRHHTLAQRHDEPRTIGPGVNWFAPRPAACVGEGFGAVNRLI